MKFSRFTQYRDVVIKNDDHARIVRLFYPYLRSVSGDARLLPDLLGRLLGEDFSSRVCVTACFNGVNDGTPPPYDDVDLYVKFDDGQRVFVYATARTKRLRTLNDNEYAIVLPGELDEGAQSL